MAAVHKIGTRHLPERAGQRKICVVMTRNSIVVLCIAVALLLGGFGTFAVAGDSSSSAPMPCESSDAPAHGHHDDCAMDCAAMPDHEPDAKPWLNSSRKSDPGKKAAHDDRLHHDVALAGTDNGFAPLPRTPPASDTATPVARHDVLLD